MSSTKLIEKCGIVALYTPKFTHLLNLALLAAGGVQHRGQQGAGIALQTRKSLKTYKDAGLLHDVFTPKVVKKLNFASRFVLVHCRYGTYGAYQKENLQPCIVQTKNGDKITVIHNGEFTAINDLRKKLHSRYSPGTSDTYLFAQFLAQQEGTNWEEKIIKALSRVAGAYSLFIAVNNVLFAARDPLGIKPLIYGKIHGGWLLASETHAFDKVGAKILGEIRKGEIILIDKNGFKFVNQTKGKNHFCDFEWAYFSRPNSLLPTHEKNDDYKKPKNWLSITLFRERCGRTLAHEFPIQNATFAVGVPDSGINITTAFANKLNIPYRQVIVRDHFDPNGSQRLFMRDDQKEEIKKKVLGKLSLVPDKNIWKNAIVVIGDDSIVRGNVSRRVTEAVFKRGAKEVHWIIGFPPVVDRCHLGISMRTKAELLAVRHRANAEKIARDIGATSVHYISPTGFIQARLLTKKPVIPKNPKEIFLVNGGCGGCLTGIYPVDKIGNFYKIPT